jgi:hypothetical protein
MEDIYFKMIGNVPELTTFNRSVKPKYKLKIPLQFWFCRFTGLAIPLVALEYHDVTLNIKFKKIQELSYIESDNTIKYSKSDTGIQLMDVPDQLNLNIDARLLIDYYYIDSVERRRFAQSSHEYLIDQLQVLELTNINQQQLQIVLNNFVHPSKELIWVSQKKRYTVNPNGTNKCRWDNYSLTDENVGNPIAYSSMDFHSFTRMMRLDGNYYNYVQPYETHWTIPSDGVNMYSFSVFPEESQPSGSANFSRLSRIVLQLEFDKSLFPAGVSTEQLTVRVYTRNINILRIISGMAGLAFVYG